MVVSGVPNPIGVEHSKVMCVVALNMLQETARFAIPHMPQERIYLRIGIHTGFLCALIWLICITWLKINKVFSGKVAAAVVGFKNPRFRVQLEYKHYCMHVQYLVGCIAHISDIIHNFHSTVRVKWKRREDQGKRQLSPCVKYDHGNLFWTVFNTDFLVQGVFFILSHLFFE